MDEINTKYDEWCRRIAESKDIGEIISHFREHVSEHYDRHNRKGKLSLDTWLAGVLNFMYILEKKVPYITTEDRLFKLCTYHKNHKDEGPEAPFDVEKFIEKYNGEIKKLEIP